LAHYGSLDPDLPIVTVASPLTRPKLPRGVSIFKLEAGWALVNIIGGNKKASISNGKGIALTCRRIAQGTVSVMKIGIAHGHAAAGI